MERMNILLPQHQEGRHKNARGLRNRDLCVVFERTSSVTAAAQLDVCCAPEQAPRARLYVCCHISKIKRTPASLFGYTEAAADTFIDELNPRRLSYRLGTNARVMHNTKPNEHESHVVRPASTRKNV